VTGSGPGRLASEPNVFDDLRDRAAEIIGVPAGAIEKDYWATEGLRSVSRPMSGIARIVFKGGTSLSKAFRLIDRFSEDMDVIAVLDDGITSSGLKEALRRLGDRAAVELAAALTREQEGRGFLNVRLAYDARADAPFLSAGVLLEIGSRGGPEPSETRQVRSLMSEAAENVDPTALDEFADLQPFTVHVLAPERTLAEKLAFLHHRASTGDAGALTAGARHLYDVALLLDNDDVRSRIAHREIAGLMEDIDARSAAAGWGYTARPSTSFADSPAFSPALATTDALRDGYQALATLVWGRFPTFEEALSTVHRYRHLI